MRPVRWILLTGACLLLAAGCRNSGSSGSTPSAADSVPTVLQSSSTKPVELRTDTLLVTSVAPAGPQDRPDAISPMPARRTGETAPSRTPYSPPEPGDVRVFRVANLPDATYRTVEATLIASDSLVEMWVEKGFTVDSGAIAASMREIKERILPALEAIYGERGGEAVPLCAVLNVRTSGASGYYAAVDASAVVEAAPPLFVMNVAAVAPGTEQYAAVLAHEMQHVWLARLDPNEAAWVSEGASQLLETLAGYPGPLQAMAAFAEAPEIQLNTWSTARGDVYRHYGASFLLLYYYYERFGLEGLQLLLSYAEDGTGAFDRVLAQTYGSSFRELFADWVVANLIDRPDLGEGAFGYRNLDVAVSVQESITHHSTQRVLTTRPYAARYVALDVGKSAEQAGVSVHLDAPTTTRLVPAVVPDGPTMWWSNRGDAGHSWVERSIDLSTVATASLTYDLWHDIEAGWDWAGVRVSTDGGATWEWLSGRHTVMSLAGEQGPQPVYTGKSGPGGVQAEWVKEEIDLSPYAGEPILLRFDMFTDDAQTEPGLCLDNIAVEAIDWFDEDDDVTGWSARGFVRTDAVVPVEYVARVALYSGDCVTIQELVFRGGHARWMPGGDGEPLDRAVLMISPITDASGPLTTEEIPITLTLLQER